MTFSTISSRSLKMIAFCTFIVCFCISCEKDVNIHPLEVKNTTAAVTPYTFNWETIDWMPTPPGQSLIPIPWVGQGSISSIYGMEVVNDRKATDGWELLYNTFNPNAPGQLVNPYFILYNKYRGLMRVFLYTTTQFVSPSTYLQDGLSVISASKSSMLNFMGTDLIDPLINYSTYSQMQPAPTDGSQPLASNKWYMMQYELAYDPNISQIPYNNIQLSWSTNFYNVNQISLGGEIVGTLKSVAGSSKPNFFSALGGVARAAGTLALAGVGQNMLLNKAINTTTGANTMGLPNKIFKAAYTGAEKAVSNAQSGIYKPIVNFFSALVGGSSSGATMNFNLNADVTLEGTSTSSGSFPSSPTSMWVPGTTIPSFASGYIPLYSNTLGVFNITSKPKVKEHTHWRHIRTGSPREGFSMRTKQEYTITSINNSSLIIFNDKVEEIASLKIIKQDVIYIPNKNGYQGFIIGHNGTIEEIGFHGEVYVNPTRFNISGIRNFDAAVRFTIEVEPKNGAPKSIIVKTFLAEIIATETHVVEHD